MLSQTTATTIRIIPSIHDARNGKRFASSKPRPKPKRLCIRACGLKHSFILSFMFIFSHPPSVLYSISRVNVNSEECKRLLFDITPISSNYSCHCERSEAICLLYKIAASPAFVVLLPPEAGRRNDGIKFGKVGLYFYFVVRRAWGF